MSDSPLLVTSSSAVAGILSGGIIIGSLVLGVFATLLLIFVFGIKPFWLAAIVGIGGTAAVLSYLSYQGAKGTEIRFYEQGLEAEANTGEGADFSAFTDRKMRYDEIDLVVRDDELGDGIFGTGTFELVVPGVGTVRLPYLEQPDRVHRILDDRVPRPRELKRQYERGELGRESHLWAFWDGHDVPEHSVVDADAFEEMAAFDVHGADSDAVVELSEFTDSVGVDSDDVSGIDSVDGVDAGAFDGGGGGADGGGGFGGGDGGGGGE